MVFLKDVKSRLQKASPDTTSTDILKTTMPTTKDVVYLKNAEGSNIKITKEIHYIYKSNLNFHI